MKHDEKWFSTGSNCNFNECRWGGEPDFDLNEAIAEVAKEYAEHMNTKLQARVDELEAALRVSNTARQGFVNEMAVMIGMKAAPITEHPLLADKEDE